MVVAVLVKQVFCVCNIIAPVVGLLSSYNSYFVKGRYTSVRENGEEVVVVVVVVDDGCSFLRNSLRWKK